MKLNIVADFETNKDIEVYSAAWCVVGDMDPRCVKVCRSMNQFLNDLFNLNFTTINCYFHNLKYDGSFIINYLKTKTDMQDRYWKRRNQLKNGEYCYLISKNGAFFNICLKWQNILICFIDSYKIIPYSLEKIGEDFQTKYRKTTMDFDVDRDETTELTEEETEYIKNDVLVLSEVMDIFINKMGLKQETIAGCAMHDFIKTLGGKQEFEKLFPADISTQETVRTFLTNARFSIAELTDGKATNIDEFCRLSYCGGWNYLNPEKQNKIIHGGVCVDKNSMYPAVMKSCPLPFGDPYLFFGAPTPKEESYNSFYVININVSLKLKRDKLPFLYCDSFLFSKQRYLESTYIEYGPSLQYKEYQKVNLTITKPELSLMFENYEIIDLDYNFGLCFPAKKGIFDRYINKWYKIKTKEEGAKKATAKLMLNSLYGRFGQKGHDQIKRIDQDVKELNKFENVDIEKKPGFIAVAAAITAYARCDIVKKAQLNIDHWIYSDTDSLQFDCPISEIKGIEIDQKELGKWKIEETFDIAVFVKNKVYIVISTAEDIRIKIKAAGLTKNGKNKIVEKLLKGEMTIEDFKKGLVIENGRTVNRQVPGGVAIFEEDWKIQ